MTEHARLRSYPEDLKDKDRGRRRTHKQRRLRKGVKFSSTTAPEGLSWVICPRRTIRPTKAQRPSADYLAGFKLKKGTDYELMVANRYEPTEGFVVSDMKIL